MSEVRLPKARVRARPGDLLHFGGREGAYQTVDDAWWDDVLGDPCARAPTAHYLDDDHPLASYRLDRQRAHFQVACPCGRLEAMDRDKIIRQCGPSMNVLYLVREWMPCRERNKMANWCRAYVVR